MSEQSAHTLIDYLADLISSTHNLSHNTNLNISFYGGEPLLNITLIESIVKYAKKKIPSTSRALSFSMTTNGLLLKRHIKFLIAHDFHILISLDGDKVGNSLRISHDGSPSFDSVISNVDYVYNSHRDYFNQNISFNSVIHAKTSVSNAIGFIYSRYGKVPRIGELTTTGVRPEAQPEFDKLYTSSQQIGNSSIADKFNSNLPFAQSSTDYQQAAGYLRNHSGRYFDTYLDLLRKETAEPLIPTGTCLPFSRKVFLTVDGKILPCERISHSYEFGHILGSEVILNFDYIRKLYDHLFEPMIQLCSTCYRRFGCMQCIFHLKQRDSDIHKCNGYMNKYSYSSFESKQLFYLQSHPEHYVHMLKHLVFS